jgi:hypothetical protein
MVSCLAHGLVSAPKQSVAIDDRTGTTRPPEGHAQSSRIVLIGLGRIFLAIRGSMNGCRQSAATKERVVKDPRFTQANSPFVMTCAVEVNIRADTDVVWSLLTDAKRFPRWNSTVARIDGEIREGERLRLHVPGTSRTFTPKVSGIVPARRMTWSDGFGPVFKGIRTFELRPGPDGSTDFRLQERFSGFVFALIKRMLPAFRPIFQAYANDLKREAERIAPPR